MNAGDTFAGPESLRLMLRGAPPDAGVVTSSHFYVTTDGIEQVHKVGEFEALWKQLVAGRLPANWIPSMPCHQATLVRRELLARYRFDLRYKIAADHELLYRLRSGGVRFHLSPIVAARYYGGGYSAANPALCVREWNRATRQHSMRKKAVDRFFLKMESAAVFSSPAAHAGLVRFALRHPRMFCGEIVKRTADAMKRQISKWQQGGVQIELGTQYTPWPAGPAADVVLDRPISGLVKFKLRYSSDMAPALASKVVMKIGDRAVKMPVAKRKPNFMIYLFKPAAALSLRYDGPLEAGKTVSAIFQEHIFPIRISIRRLL
jgi:hypothetical protein